MFRAKGLRCPIIVKEVKGARKYYWAQALPILSVKWPVTDEKPPRDILPPTEQMILIKNVSFFYIDMNIELL